MMDETAESQPKECEVMRDKYKAELEARKRKREREKTEGVVKQLRIWLYGDN